MKQRTFFPVCISFFAGLIWLGYAMPMRAQNGQIDSLEHILSESTDEQRQMDLLSQLAQLQSDLNTDKFLTLAKRGRALAAQQADPTWTARFDFLLGEAFLLKAEYDTALVYYTSAEKAYQNLGDRQHLVEVYMRMAHNYKSQGRFDKALEYHLNALNTCEKQGDEHGIARAYAQISDDFYYQDDYEKGVEYGQRGVELSKRLGDQESLALAYQFSSGSYMQMARYDEALYGYNHALEIRRGMNTSPIALASLLNSRGNTYKFMKRYDEALKDYFDCLPIVEKLDHKAGISSINGNIGHVYMFQGEYAKALPYKLICVNIMESIGYKAHLWENYMHTSEIYEHLGNYKNALDYYKKYKAQNDSVFTLEQGREMSELRLKYETEKKEGLIATQEKQLAQQKTIQLFSFGVAGLLAVILVLGLVAFRQKQKSNRLLADTNTQLEYKNRENELLLKEIHHRVKNNLQTISSLLNLQSAGISDPSALEAVQESQSRVRSMALIHQKLYQGEKLAAVEMKDYFETMGEVLLESFARQRGRVRVECPMEELELDVDTAIPLGLIANELITNSLKYAFPGKKNGEIRISLQKETDKTLCFRIADNGTGMKGEKDTTFGPGTGFGGRLVQLLTLQLGGQLEQYEKGGLETVIRFRPAA